jgi:hypothetical protein
MPTEDERGKDRHRDVETASAGTLSAPGAGINASSTSAGRITSPVEPDRHMAPTTIVENGNDGDEEKKREVGTDARVALHSDAHWPERVVEAT